MKKKQKIFPVNVQDFCTDITLDLSEIPENVLAQMKEDGAAKADDAIIRMHYMEAKKYGIEKYADEFHYSAKKMDELIKSLFPRNRSGMVLLLAKNCTWDGRDGYEITPRESMFYRSYDVSQKVYFADGKVARMREFSHDRPSGYEVTIVDLTKSELALASIDAKAFGDLFSWVAAL